MSNYKDLNQTELLSLKKDLEMQYEDIKKQNLCLNMARGKPDVFQTELSIDMLDVINSQTDFHNHKDYLNYGILDGITEAKSFFAELLETTIDHIIVYGNSSLNIMFDQMSRGFTHGYNGCTPWYQLKKKKFLCPVPGYDRHFAISEHFGFEMILIPLNDNGPDMNLVEEYVQSDDSIKGIWCVPQYSNPTGTTYSKETVNRLANLKPAAKDFKIFWDNAYIAHHLYDDKQEHVENILDACEKAGNPDLVFEFCSTSKVTFPGSGVAALATSPNNKNEILQHMNVQTIGYDKINQLRHTQYFKDVNGLKEHMKKQANILRPKFEVVLDIFEKELSGLGIGTWSKPIGGYFISFDALDHCAKKIVELCKNAGTTLTSAGATYPYGLDPNDSNIRIAPSYPSIKELKQAAQLFVICVKIVSIDKILG